MTDLKKQIDELAGIKARKTLKTPNIRVSIMQAQNQSLQR